MPADWAKAAWLVANGATTDEIVAATGCSRGQLRRRESSCGLFRALVEQYRSVLANDDEKASLRTPHELALTVRRKLEREIDDGNMKVVIWLAERLRLFTPNAGEDAEAMMERLLASMTEEERKAFTRAD